jgi:hypothetical protein
MRRNPALDANALAGDVACRVRGEAGGEAVHRVHVADAIVLGLAARDKRSFSDETRSSASAQESGVGRCVLHGRFADIGVVRAGTFAF